MSQVLYLNVSKLDRVLYLCPRSYAALPSSRCVILLLLVLARHPSPLFSSVVRWYGQRPGSKGPALGRYEMQSVQGRESADAGIRTRVPSGRALALPIHKVASHFPIFFHGSGEVMFVSYFVQLDLISIVKVETLENQILPIYTCQV